jgi:CRP-like cAMP-binding protein
MSRSEHAPTVMRPGIPTVGPVERALALRSLPLFRALPAREVSVLAQLLREQAIPRGRQLQSAGSRVSALHLLTDGRVRIERDGAPATSLEAPQALGLIELLAGAPARLTVTADTNVMALVIDRGALLDVLEDQFLLVLHLRDALGGELAARQADLGRYDLPRTEAVPMEPAAVGSTALDLVQALLWLEQIPELRALGVAVLAALLGEEPTTRFAAGELLLAAGTEATRFLVLVEGDVVCTAADGATSFRAGRGDALGRDAVLAGLAHPYSAVAETAGIAIPVDAQVFWDQAEDNFQVALAALSMSARRLLWLEELEPDRPHGGITAAAPAGGRHFDGAVPATSTEDG